MVEGSKNTRINMAFSLTSKQMTPLVVSWQERDDQSQEAISTNKMPLNVTLAPMPELPKASCFIFANPGVIEQGNNQKLN